MDKSECFSGQIVRVRAGEPKAEPGVVKHLLPDYAVVDIHGMDHTILYSALEPVEADEPRRAPETIPLYIVFFEFAEPKHMAIIYRVVHVIKTDFANFSKDADEYRKALSAANIDPYKYQFMLFERPVGDFFKQYLEADK